MKFLKIAVMSAIALAFGNAYAFHSGGVAECEGCHTMHNSHGGDPMANPPGTGIYLLRGNDQSSACLNCHGTGATLSGYHVSTEGTDPAINSGSVPQQMTPGGDFSWLKINTAFNVRGTTLTSYGERRGHNIVAADFGYGADTTLTTAPGGTFPAASLQCSSCHDPHGRYRRFADGTYGTTGLPIRASGSYHNSPDAVTGIYAAGAYRILAGAGYAPKSNPGFPFVNQVPDAVSPSSYNRAEATNAGQTFVAYGQGMSEWCGNCHAGFVQDGYTSGMAGLRHPAGNSSNLTAAIVTNYNAYVTSGIMTNATATAAYSTLTPFEVGTNDYAILKTRATLGASDRAATTGNNVACISCHRVHAGGFESMLRFFYLNEFMTIGDNAGVASYETSGNITNVNGNAQQRSQGLMPDQIAKAYYDRPPATFGPWARMQCNKCHAKD